ncbi:MAG: OmpA family protein [Flavobacterium sp.]|nr:OmpA family protein [Pedobacter sp.]
MLSKLVVAAPADTLRVYYNVNQKHLTNSTKLDSLIKQSNSLKKQIALIGYADFLGAIEYNQKLALERATLIKHYLDSLITGFEISASGKGEIVGYITTGLQGDPLYRRVDVIYNHNEVVLSKPKPAVGLPKPPAKIVRREPIIIEDNNLTAKERINGIASLNVGEAISLDEITFKPGRHYLRSEAVPYLVRMLKVLKKNPNVNIEIQGHICCESDGRDGLDIDEGTVNLSVNRAKFIYEFFIKEGVSANRLSFIGLGSSKLKVFPEADAEDEVKNRRVVFMVTGK